MLKSFIPGRLLTFKELQHTRVFPAAQALNYFSQRISYNQCFQKAKRGGLLVPA